MKPHFLLLLCMLITRPVLVRADQAAAARNYEQGMEHYEAREFEAALRAFERAYTADPAPILQYNIAQCHWKLGHDEEAIRGYERYLEAEPNSEDRAGIEARIATLRAKPKHPGRRPPAATPQVELDEPGVAEGGPSPLRIAAYGTGAVALASLAAGTVFGVMTRDANDEAEMEGTEYKEADYEAGERLETLQFVFLGVGTAAAIASGIMFIFDATVEKREQSAVALLPVVTADAAGLSTRVGF